MSYESGGNLDVLLDSSHSMVSGMVITREDKLRYSSRDIAQSARREMPNAPRQVPMAGAKLCRADILVSTLVAAANLGVSKHEERSLASEHLPLTPAQATHRGDAETGELSVAKVHITALQIQGRPSGGSPDLSSARIAARYDDPIGGGYPGCVAFANAKKCFEDEICHAPVYRHEKLDHRVMFSTSD